MSADSENEVEDVFELAPMQVSMLLQTLLAPGSGVFVEQQVVPISGRLDRRAFESAWQSVLQRNSALRCSFHWEDLEKPVQVAHRNVPLPIEFHDWSGVPVSERRGRLEAHLASRRRTGFDLATAPLLQIEVVELSPAEAWFIWHFHHILLDGWSAELVLKELVDEYLARLRRVPPVPPNRRPFQEFIGWLQAQDPRHAEAFWKRELEGFHAPTLIPIGRNIPGRFPTHADEDRVECELSDDASQTLRHYCREQRVTLNTVFEAAWAIVLSRYSGDPDVLFGTVVSGRPAHLPGVESMVGLFMNVLPMRVRLSSPAHVGDWLRQLQRWQTEALEHQHVSTVQMRRWCAVPEDVELYATALVFENHPAQTPGTRGAPTASEYAIDVGRTNLPVTAVIIPGTRIRWRILFDRGRFDRGAAERLSGHWREALRQIVEKPEGALGDVSIVTDDERRWLAEAGNASAPPLDVPRSLVELLEIQCAATPDAVAYIDGALKITFHAIWNESRRCAAILQTHGVAPGDPVGIFLPRSAAQAIAFLGVLLAGGVYVPLDPAYPAERLAFMLGDSGARVLVVPTGARVSFPAKVPRIDFELGTFSDTSGPEAPAEFPRRAADDLAYIIYTSGSTGQPKGVAADHAQILNRLAWMWNAYPFAPHEVACHKAPLSFVDSLWELLGALLRGRPTVILPDSVVADPPRLVEALATHRVTRLWVVPSFLEALLESGIPLAERLPSLDFWVSTGEPLTSELQHKFQRQLPHAVLHNVYGMSEIWDATWFDPSRDAVGDGHVPIGRPLTFASLSILDDAGRPVPIGVPGQLHVGGPGLARGYLHRDDLTRERFIERPEGLPGAGRLFRTGDRVSFREDGVVQYLGRCDFQIKLRGFRIDPGEVEAALTAAPGVRESLVMPHANGATGARLIAYLIPEGTEKNTGRVLEHVRGKLPGFMVPSAVVWLDEFPRTPSGKRDRRALPPPENGTVSAAARVPPRTPFERVVLDRFIEVLAVPAAGVHDHFFRDLGGHSLLATRLISRLRQDVKLDLPLRLLFEAPTAAGLAEAIERLQGAELPQEAEALLREIDELSPQELEALVAQLDTPSGP